MSGLVLHGAPISTCTNRVRVVAAQAGIPVTLDPAALADIATPEWTEKQPFNQMPYFVDEKENLTIFESRAIGKYLALKAGSDLVPKQSDVKAYALFEQACSIEQANFDPAASGLAYELVFAPMFGKVTDAARVETLKATLAKRLPGYERILAKQKYMAGDKLTVADLFHLPYGKMVADLGVAPGLTDGSLPNVTRWWKEISSLPAWTELTTQK